MTDIVLAGGCFWCLDAVYRQFRGVEASVCGYTGGETPDPDYRSVCSGATGHQEALKLSFDPQLPDGWDGYAFKIVYRGRLIEVSVSRDGTGLKLLSGDTLTVLLHGREVTLVGASLNPEDEND